MAVGDLQQAAERGGKKSTTKSGSPERGKRTIAAKCLNIRRPRGKRKEKDIRDPWLRCCTAEKRYVPAGPSPHHSGKEKKGKEKKGPSKKNRHASGPLAR